MEAIRTLIRGVLPPVGNRISARREQEVWRPPVLGYTPCWLDSGTSALALALLDLRRRHPNIVQPQVVIPGYCCPDLVAAAVYAGVRPVAVDIGAQDASYNLQALEDALTPRTLAVIAVNFLGIQERLAALHSLLDNRGIALIEDNAQWFPDSEYHSCADYVVFSFGRGKPLSLLGGGVLMSKNPLACTGTVEAAPSLAFTYRLKLWLYNLLLHPRGYALVNLLPGIALGQTYYDPLLSIREMDSMRRELLSHNYRRYCQRSRGAELAYTELLQSNGEQHLRSLVPGRAHRLLRYPLLCASSARRSELLERFTQEGLGASPLYGAAIDEIAGVEGLVDVPRPLVAARHLASCLLTLPVHDQLGERH